MGRHAEAGPDLDVSAVAEFDVLFEGYLGRPDHRVGSTVSLVRAGDGIIVIDPGLVPGPNAILDPLASHGVRPEQVTDVVFSHHHPDHTINAALFPDARFHDHWAIYQGDLWTASDAEGRRIAPGVTLAKTPGHTNEDVSTLVETDHGLVVFTHLWWTAEGPADDPYSPDRELLRANRRRLLDLRPALIVPGHGAPFEPSDTTAR